MLSHASSRAHPGRVRLVASLGASLLLASLFVLITPTASFAALNGTFAIQNKKTWKCADLPGFGAGTPDTPVNQYSCNFSTGDNQRWKFVPRGQAQGGSGAFYNRYQIINEKDGLCLDAPGYGANANGALVSEYPCRGTGDAGTGDNQRWYTVLRTASDGRTGVWIVNEASRKCLDVRGFSAGNDARLTLYTCSDAAAEDHYWRITSSPVTPSTRQLPSQLAVSAAIQKFTADYEGYRGSAYSDFGGNCTIGYGHLLHRGSCVNADRALYWSQSYAYGRFVQDLDSFAKGVRSSIPNTPLKQQEFDALLSFAFAVGMGNFGISKVREDLTASPPQYSFVPGHFYSFVKSGGVKSCGMWRRRTDEGEIFTRAEYLREYPSCPAGYSRTPSMSGMSIDAERG